MHGKSFCVSYYNPCQLDDVIPLLAEDSILVLDNGGYSAWQDERIVLDHRYWTEFTHWAALIMSAVPQAIAILPDVIGGDTRANLAMALQFALELPLDRIMPVWHIDEDLAQLTAFLDEGFVRLAFGSAGRYRTPGTTVWHDRIGEAFEHLYALVGDGTRGYPCPSIHMLRGLAQLRDPYGIPFSSADSTDVAKNHWRTRDQMFNVAKMCARIEAQRFPDSPIPVWPAHSWEPRMGVPTLARPTQIALIGDAA